MGRASSGILVTGGLLARRPGRSGDPMTPPGEAPFCPSIYAPSGDKETLTIAAKVKLRVLPNLDVVAADRPPSAADVLFLERFSERRSESVWHLSRDKVLAAVEHGLEVGELKEFLASRGEGPLPQTAEVFLADLEGKAGELEDLGAARLVLCKGAVVAPTLSSHP